MEELVFREVDVFALGRLTFGDLVGGAFQAEQRQKQWCGDGNEKTFEI